MKSLYLCLLLGGLLACQRHDPAPDSQPTPAGYDALARAVGHWQWVNTLVPFQGITDSASVGYGRQLIFRADSMVQLHRSGRPDTAAAYRLSAGLLTHCGNRPARLLFYQLAEPGGVRNNDLKAISLSRNSQGVSRLSIVGEGACVDGGLYEYYRWVPGK